MGELLLHPTRQVGSRHATHATTTQHGRHGAPARHVGRRVTRQAAAVTQHSARPGGTQQPAMIKPSRFAKKKRASDMEKLQTHPVAIADTNSFVLRLPSLQEPLEIGGQLVLVRSTGLRRRVEIQRLLVVEMVAGTNAVASQSFYRFGGRLRGVLAGARGTWAGVVLGHKTAVLAKLPQVGQPCCGNLSKSTVPVTRPFID